MSTDSLKGRLLLLIDSLTTPHRRFKQLEELTGIASDRWKAFAAGRQRATEEMIEAIGRAYPDLVMWLICGPDRQQNYLDPQTFMALRKFNIDEVLKKEPSDISDEEMLVLEHHYPHLREPVIDQRIPRAINLARLNDTPGLFSADELLEMRRRGLSREQYLKEQFDSATGEDLAMLIVKVFGFRGEGGLPPYLQNARWLTDARNSFFHGVRSGVPSARKSTKKATAK